MGTIISIFCGLLAIGGLSKLVADARAEERYQLLLANLTDIAVRVTLNKAEQL